MLEWPLCWLIPVGTFMVTQVWHGKECKDLGCLPRVPVESSSSYWRASFKTFHLCEWFPCWQRNIILETVVSGSGEDNLKEWICFPMEDKDDQTLFVDTATMWLHSILYRWAQQWVAAGGLCFSISLSTEDESCLWYLWSIYDNKKHNHYKYFLQQFCLGSAMNEQKLLIQTGLGKCIQCSFGFKLSIIEILFHRQSFHNDKRTHEEGCHAGPVFFKLSSQNIKNHVKVLKITSSPSQQEGPGFDSGSVHFCVEFTCSPCVCVGSLRVLPHSKQHANWGLG